MKKRMQTIETEITALFDKYTDLATDDTDRGLMADTKTAWQKYTSLHNQMITLSRENKAQEAMVMVNGETKPAETATNCMPAQDAS